jgi:RNA polymerase sigma factor (sigma-70 family)
MARGQLETAVRHIQRLVAEQTTGAQTDGELLRRFSAQRDEGAFAALVDRHGRLVLRLCQSLLHQEQDAEDCFQATFILLAQKAGTIRRSQAVGSWLYGVAHRVAMNAKRKAARRRTHEREAARREPPSEGPQPADRGALREIQAVLEDEVARLPEKYRAPFVLCCLEGASGVEAARELRCKPGTLTARLTRARQMLRRRLTRRGVTLSAALSAQALFVPGGGAAVPAALTAATVKAGLLTAAGTLTAGALSSAVTTLVKGVSEAMFLNKLKVVCLLLAIVVAATSVATVTCVRIAQGDTRTESRPPFQGPRVRQAVPVEKPRVDRMGDPLPQGATARLGTVRLKPGLNVDFVAFLPGGKTVVSPGWKSIRFWEAATGKELRRIELPGHVSHMAITPDGRTLAATCRGTARLWDTGTLKEISQFQASGRLTFAHDGRKLLSRAGNALHLWDAANGKKLGSVSPPPSRLLNNPFAFSADDRQVVTFCEDEILFTSLSSGKQERRIKVNIPALGDPAFSPDGKLLAVGVGNTIAIFDLVDGREIRRVGRRGQSSPIAFAPDKKVLVSGGDALVLWDVNTGAEIRSLPSPGIPVSVAMSPNGKLLAQGNSWMSGLHLWDVGAGKEIDRQLGDHGEVSQVVFSPDGKNVVSRSSQDQTLRIWETDTGKQARLIGTKGSERRADAGYGPAIAYSPDGRFTALGDFGGSVRIWDTKDGKESRELKIDITCRHMTALSFAADGRTIAVSGSRPKHHSSTLPGCITVFDLGNGKTILKQNLPCTPVTSVFSPGHSCLAIADEQDRLWLWDLARNRSALVLEQRAYRMAFSPDGRFLATTSWAPTGAASAWNAHIWEVASGKKVLTLGIDGWTVCFSPDGLLATGADKAIQVWSLATAQPIAQFRGHRVPTTCMAFSPDGKRLATGQTDSTTLVWDVAAVARQPHIPVRALQSEDLGWLWETLADAEAAKAYAAVWTLSGARDQAVSLLRSHLSPARRADAKHIGRLLADLDSSRFTTRTAASRELEQLGTQAEAALREALQRKPSPEAQRGIEVLLAKLSILIQDPRLLRAIRAVLVLEQIATPEARRLLNQLAKGAPEARLTQEAKRTLDRLDRRRLRDH